MRPTPHRRLRFDARVDVPVGLAVGATGISLVLLRPWLASPTCAYSCTPEGLLAVDAQARERLLWANADTAKNLGDVVGYAGLPAFVAASALVGAAEGESGREIFEDTWIIAEAFATAHVLESVVKYSTARARPDTTFGSRPLSDPSDFYTSMVSGHATAAFSVAVATGVVATLRGRKSAPWLWLSGLALATFNSYLRIAGDRHYLTDVLAGAALGSAVGLIVPLVFHGTQAPVTVSPYASPGGAGVSVGGHF